MSTDLIYSGCYGEMLYQQNGATPYHYQDYVLGTSFLDIAADQLEKNYRKFQRKANNNLTLEVVVNEYIIDPNYIIQFVNTTSDDLHLTAATSSKWCIVGIETDLINDITSLKLIGQA